MLVNLDDLNDNSLSSESNTKLELPSDTETNLTMKKSKFKVCFHPARGCKGASWEDQKPPTVNQALKALEELNDLLKPHYKNNANQKRYKESS